MSTPSAQALSDGRVQVRLGRIWVDNVTMEQTVSRVAALIAARRSAYVVTPNVDHVVRCERDSDYADLVADADLVVPDGQPLIWAARLLGAPLRERVAGSDLFPRLCAEAAQTGWRVFLLGGDPGAADDAARVLQTRYPNLLIAGTHCPSMGFDRDAAATQAAVDAVRAAQPDLVFVGLGSPKQERFIRAHQQRYGPAVSVGIGISFSFVAGRVKRAPRWMQRAGIEWLHRLASEPRRLWRRYLVEDPAFLGVILRQWRGGEPVRRAFDERERREEQA